MEIRLSIMNNKNNENWLAKYNEDNPDFPLNIISIHCRISYTEYSIVQPDLVILLLIELRMSLHPPHNTVTITTTNNV